jgi:hypothetical protein
LVGPALNGLQKPTPGNLRKTIASILVAALTVVLTGTGVLGLGRVAARVSLIENPMLRILCTFAELIAGLLWLLGTIFVTTRLAVLIFADRNQSSTLPD